jgi:hypothetical protein
MSKETLSKTLAFGRIPDAFKFYHLAHVCVGCLQGGRSHAILRKDYLWGIYLNLRFLSRVRNLKRVHNYIDL